MIMKLFKVSVSVMLVFSILTLTISPAFAVNTMYEGYSSNAELTQNEISLGNEVIESEIYANKCISELQIEDIIADPQKGVADLDAAILKKDIYADQMTTKREIANVDTFISALKMKYPQMNEIDLGKIVLLSLGDTEEFISTLPDEKIIEALNYTYVIKTESFYKQSADGENVEVSEEVYYEEIARIESKEQFDTVLTNGEANAGDVSIQTFSAYDDSETKDSYVKLTSIAYKTNPSYAQSGRNYFTIRGEVEWTKTPYFQDKDILAIASSGNIDQDYSAFGYACWSAIDDLDFDDYAYIDQNGGKGQLKSGDLLKIYNVGLKGIALDIEFNVSGYLGILKNAYIFYGISTQEDVTCQVGYAHKTLGIGDPSVSIDSSCSVSFSVGLTATINEYFGKSFTLYHESYDVSLISPSNNATIAYSDVAPTFSWSLNSASPEQFILEIDYLSSGENFYKSYILAGSCIRHTIPASDWGLIAFDSPFVGNVKIIKWRIAIDYVIYPDETQYVTGWNTFTITGVPMETREVLPTITSNARYTEKRVNLSTGSYKDLVVKFSASGNQLLQTFGTKDTVLELYSSDGTLLLEGTDTDDNGYGRNALLAYNFAANTEYIVRVRYYSSTTSGVTKIAIIPTYSYETYEDIYSLVDYKLGLTWNLTQNNVKLMTYKYSTTQDLTMNVTSEVDTYLYIIDPRSAEPIQEASDTDLEAVKGFPSLYNDDYLDSTDSRITKTFEANVPYLVIVSAYNPSSTTSVGEFYLDFK